MLPSIKSNASMLPSIEANRGADGARAIAEEEKKLAEGIDLKSGSDNDSPRREEHKKQDVIMQEHTSPIKDQVLDIDAVDDKAVKQIVTSP